MSWERITLSWKAALFWAVIVAAICGAIVYFLRRVTIALNRRWNPPEWESLTDFLTYSDRTLKRIMAQYIDNEAVRNLCFNLLQIRNTEKLVRKTWLLAIATWFLCLVTAAVAIFGSDLKRWLCLIIPLP